MLTWSQKPVKRTNLTCLVLTWYFSMNLKVTVYKGLAICGFEIGHPFMCSQIKLVTTNELKNKVVIIVLQDNHQGRFKN